MEWFKEYRKDLILILAVFVGAGLIAGGFLLAKKPGAYVRVERNGKMIALYPLNEDRRVLFPPESEEGIAPGTDSSEIAGNILVIRDGSVYMELASCPDRLCVNQGTKRNIGETIVCLPHRLVVTVVSAEEAEELMP